MWPYHPELLAKPVPRYTSYPTAAEFQDDVGAPELATALAGIGAETPISLYLHIPYCHEICWYCGCNTGAANRAARLESYVQTLGDEIDLVARSLQGRGCVGHIAFGGGSPNALAPGQFDRLMRRVKSAFACDAAELSVELDPRGFEAGFADVMNKHRVSRASLGVQTLAPHIQRAIGRVQPRETIAKACVLLRQAGVRSINFDLMYGLPQQSDEDLSETLHDAIALAPDRLAVFGYAHVPHLLPRQRRIDASGLPDGHARFAQAWQAHEILKSNGYTAIGFDHFALSDDPLARAMRERRLHRNFQGFTDDQAECLIGLGASSISCFPDRIVQNEKNAGRYRARIGAGEFAAARGVERTMLDRRRGAIISDLLCHGEADCGGLLDLPLLRGALEPFEALGLVKWRSQHLMLSEDAVPYARVIAARFDRFRKASMTQFSNAI